MSVLKNGSIIFHFLKAMKITNIFDHTKVPILIFHTLV